MNLQCVRRVAVYAALIVLSVAGAGLYPARPAAGQVIKPIALRGAAAIEQLKREGQYDQLRMALNQARFSVSRAENTPLGRWAWHAPSPTAGYDAYITEAGVSIAVGDDSYVSLSLHSLGYGAALQAVAPGKVSGDKQTINLTRDGGLQEWYVNGPEGLEHGFTLAEPPGGRRPEAGVPLRLAMQVSEGWRAEASPDGGQVTLRGAGGQAVRYGKLLVRDRAGRDIPARLTVADRQQVVIEVEDGEAAYPLTIDPLFSLQQKLLATDATAIDMFGYAVALSGDTAVIGAYADAIGQNVWQGSAYVFTRTGTTWTQQQKLTAGDGSAYDNFGSAVAISGNTVVVGAPADDVGAGAYQGSAYVYTRSGTAWTLQRKLTASDGAPNDGFGTSVALTSDMLVVGATGDDIGVVDGQGSAYLFTRAGTVWTERQKLVAATGGPGSAYGYAVALTGSTVAVGALENNFGPNQQRGSVCLFMRNGPFWGQQQTLTASDGVAGDGFGYAVAISDDTMAVGASGDDTGANTDQGSVYIFRRNGAVWTEQQKLTAADGAWGDKFGVSVALSGDTLVVGAWGDNVGGNTGQGSAYVFTRTGTTWTQQQKLTAADGSAYDYYGHAVALSGDTVMVGAHQDNVGGNFAQGSVYAYARPTCPVIAPAELSDYGAVGVPYEHQVQVSGLTVPYQFALTGGALPPGLSLSSNGLLSGTPTTLGTYQFTLTVTNLNGGCSTSRSYTQEIRTCPTYMPDPQVLPDGTMGVPYNLTLTAPGGVAPHTFGMDGDSPAGLSVSPDGVLSGTPTEDGCFTFRLYYKDATGCVTTWETSVTIIKSEIAASFAPSVERDSGQVVR